MWERSLRCDLQRLPWDKNILKKEAFSVSQSQRFSFPNKMFKSSGFNAQRPANEVPMQREHTSCIFHQKTHMRLRKCCLQEKEQQMNIEKKQLAGPARPKNPWSEPPLVNSVQGLPPITKTLQFCGRREINCRKINASLLKR